MPSTSPETRADDASMPPEKGHEPSVMVVLDEQAVIIAASGGTAAVGQNYGDELRKLCGAECEEGLSAVLSGRAPSHQCHYSANGRPFEVIVTRVDGNGGARAVVVNREIVEPEHERLRDADERFLLWSRGCADTLWDWDVRTDRLYLSPQWAHTLGLGSLDIPNTMQAWYDSIHTDDLEAVQVQMARHLKGESDSFECEYRVTAWDGTERWISSRAEALRDMEGTAYRVGGVHADITHRKQVEAQQIHDQLHDNLTGLPNRALFLDRLERAVVRARRNSNFLFGVLAIDLDNFKVVNDSLGYEMGDELLMAFANRLSGKLRANDSMARTGGDEFFILLDDIRDVSDAVRVAGRLMSVVEKPITLNGQDVFLTVSMGIALKGDDNQPADALMRDAEAAMHQAKVQGRARHHVFDTTIYKRAVNRLTLETDLRRAIDNDGLYALYQPIVNLKHGRICGFEALVRWRHPVRGVISPIEFVPMAEETGLIVPLGLVVLQQACHQLAAWQREFPHEEPLTMSVNLSGRQLAQSDFLESVLRTLESADFVPGSLHFEITESSFLDSTSSAAKMLHDIKKIGMGLYLDDFGTGYSSLSYLQKLPVDTLKIDRSFITPLSPRPEDKEIVRTIVVLAHTLRMQVVAEGIETAEHLSVLRELECDYGQGYYFSPPMTVEKVEEMMRADRRW